MRVFGSAVLALGGVALLAAPAQGIRKCRPDAVRVGTVCVDKYEASVWEIPDTNDNKILIATVQSGNITSAVFLAQVRQRGARRDDYGAGCPDTGNDCKNFYAVSIPGVRPSAYLTWFQALAACRNSGKQLATNQEWQVAAMGTPDPGTDNGTNDCNVDVDGTDVVNTGSRNRCVSDAGAFDMVGNAWEWVSDWGEEATDCTHWSETYGMDISCVGGTGSLALPGALYRGGPFSGGTQSGVFAVNLVQPTSAFAFIGFRCAREP